MGIPWRALSKTVTRSALSFQKTTVVLCGEQTVVGVRVEAELTRRPATVSSRPEKMKVVVVETEGELNTLSEKLCLSVMIKIMDGFLKFYLKIKTVG